MRKISSLMTFVLIATITGVVAQCSQPVVEGFVDAALDGDLDGALDGALDGDLDTGPSDALAQDADTDGGSSSGSLRVERFSGVLNDEGSLEFRLPDYSLDNQPPMMQLFVEGGVTAPDDVWRAGDFLVSSNGVVTWGPSVGDAGHRWQLVVIR